MASLGVVLALSIALLLPIEATAWDLDASRDPARYFGTFKLGVAAAGTALLAWGLVLRLLERPASARRLREGLLVALGALAALCWFNFFQFHQGVYLHTSEIFHHYMGSKYFRELSYSRLYDCTVVADYSSGYRFPAHKRPVRRLGSNRIDWASDVLADARACTKHFSPQRWQSFQHDVGWFRAQFHPRRWHRSRPIVVSTPHLCGTLQLRCWPTPALPRECGSWRSHCWIHCSCSSCGGSSPGPSAGERSTSH